jgi:hypothetical protein
LAALKKGEEYSKEQTEEVKRLQKEVSEFLVTELASKNKKQRKFTTASTMFY